MWYPGRRIFILWYTGPDVMYPGRRIFICGVTDQMWCTLAVGYLFCGYGPDVMYPGHRIYVLAVKKLVIYFCKKKKLPWLLVYKTCFWKMCLLYTYFVSLEMVAIRMTGVWLLHAQQSSHGYYEKNWESMIISAQQGPACLEDLTEEKISTFKSQMFCLWRLMVLMLDCVNYEI